MRDHLEAKIPFLSSHSAPFRVRPEKMYWRRCFSLLLGVIAGLGWQASAHAKAPDIGQTTDEISSSAGLPLRRHWQDLTYRLPTATFTAIGVDPGDPEVWWIGADGFVFRSDDAGESWLPVLSYPRGLPDTGLGSWNGADAQQEDAQADVARRAEQMQEDAAGFLDAADDLESGESVGLEESFGNEESADQLQAWAEDLQMAAAAAQMPAGDAEPLDLRSPRQRAGVREILVNRVAAPFVLVATPRGLFRGDLRGTSFSQIQLPGGIAENDVRAVAISSTEPATWFVGTAAGVYITEDAGESFRRGAGLASASGVIDLAWHASGARSRLWAATEIGLLVSEDLGRNWRELRVASQAPNSPTLSVAFDAQLDALYVGTPQGLAVQLGADSAIEPAPLRLGVPVIDVAVEGNLPGVVAIGTQGGGWLESDNVAASQLRDSDLLPAREIRDLAYLPGTAFGSMLAVTERGVFGLFAFEGAELTTQSESKLKEQWAIEPSWEEVGRAALRYARVHHFGTGELTPRLQNAGWAPSMRAQYRFFNGRPNRIEYVLVADEIADLDADELAEFAREGNIEINPRTGQRHEFFVFFAWDLDRFFFPPTQIAAARIRPQLQRIEQQVLSRAFDLYTSRRRLMADMLQAPGEQVPSETATQWLRLQELNALLDAQTGGFFHRELAKRLALRAAPRAAVSLVRGRAKRGGPSAPAIPKSK